MTKSKKKKKRKSQHLVPKASVDSYRLEAIVFRRDPNRVILGESESRDLQRLFKEEEETMTQPPPTLEFFFYLFLDAKNCDALVGDLEERYKIIRKKFGARRANLWYWVQVTRSVSPLAWAATKRMLKAVSGVAALVEMWRRIRS